MDYSKRCEGLQGDEQEQRQLYIPPRSGLPLRQFAQLRRQQRLLLVEFAQCVLRELRVARALHFQRCGQVLRQPLLRALRAASVPLEFIAYEQATCQTCKMNTFDEINRADAYGSRLPSPRG